MQRVYLAGLDAVRALALLLVLYQHVSSNYDQLHLPVNFMGLNAGQTGVGLFCGLSGFLAIRSAGSLRTWVMRRALRVLPPYWIMVSLAVAGNALVSYKETDLGSLLLEYLGLAYFIPPSSTLNVAAWFITLLILCYGIAAATIPWPTRKAKLWVVSVPVAVTVVLLAIRWNIVLVRQIFAFEAGLVAYIIGGDEITRWQAAAQIIVLVGLAVVGIDSRYALASTVVMVALLMGPVKRLPHFIHVLSDYSYEIFLMQGLFIVFFAKIFVCGTPVSLMLTLFSVFVASYVLKKISTQIEHKIVRALQPR
jgi:peptidoglycan/LPS O-acetylase OafA/YrhL